MASDKQRVKILPPPIKGVAKVMIKRKKVMNARLADIMKGKN